jgi:hypothetical protein
LKKVGQIILAKRCRFDLNLKNRKYFSQVAFRRCCVGALARESPTRQSSSSMAACWRSNSAVKRPRSSPSARSFCHRMVPISTLPSAVYGDASESPDEASSRTWLEWLVPRDLMIVSHGRPTVYRSLGDGDTSSSDGQSWRPSSASKIASRSNCGAIELRQSFTSRTILSLLCRQPQ